MAKRHIILTGPIRSGSTWLADMFKKNIQRDLVEFEHEVFSHNYAKALKRWRNGGPGIYGTVGHDHMFLNTLDEAFHPTWVFMWREPLQLIQSIFRWVSRNRKREPRTDEIYMRAFTVYAGLEVALATAERRGSDVLHWHFESYTTPKGFKKLGEELQLPLKDSITDVGHKNSSPKKFVNAKNWAKDAREYIYLFMKSLPHVTAAYQSARHS